MRKTSNLVIYLFLLPIVILTLSSCDNIENVVISNSVSTIKVGIIQPSGLAPSFTKGAELARSQINNRGGLLGMSVEFIIMDNQGTLDFPNAEESVRIAKTLIEEDDVVAILGPLLSTNSTEVGPVVTRLKRPIITGSSGQNVTATGEYVFIAVAPSSFQGETMAKFTLDKNELNANSAATIRQEGDIYSNAVADAFEKNFKIGGGEIVATEYYQHGDRNFDKQLSKIKDSAPDVFLIAGFIPEVPLITAKARELNIDATFIGTNAWDIPDELFNTLDDNTPLEGSFFSRDFSADSPDAVEFVNAYTDLYMQSPNGPSSWGYDAMSLLGLAIKNAGTVDPASIRDALANITDYQGASTISHFDENRHPVKNLLIHTIRNGEIVFYKSFNP